jgi:hypothetical protein
VNWFNAVALCWMFGFWIGAWVTIAGTVFALQRLH